MFDRQRLTRNGPASAFLLAIIFLTLSLAHYDPADPPGHATEPIRTSPPTLAGRSGRRWRTSCSRRSAGPRSCSSLDWWRSTCSGLRADR